MKNLVICDRSYEDIFEIKHKVDISCGHINYSDNWIEHMKKIMHAPIRYISSVRNPIERFVSHYYYSNPYLNKYDINDFYKMWYYGEISTLPGWRTEDRVDNQMSFYMGLKYKSDVDILYRDYYFVFLLEKMKESYEAFSEKMKFKFEYIHINKNIRKKKELNSNTLDLFLEKNELDLHLYNTLLKKPLW